MQVSNKHLAYWLYSGCVLILMMVLIGGVTRLTQSGLSMVDWQPITGILPPLSLENWQQVFALYQQTPEFKHINYDMDLTGFKAIFYVEYIHRIAGRITGLWFLLPYLILLLTRQISSSLSLKLFAINLLVILQGIVGWYMVKSGLIDDPDVSPYRLSLHLCMAFILFAFTFSSALNLHLPQTNNYAPTLYKISLILIIGLFLQIMMGGFVAGLDAGKAYNTFPLMDGDIIPDGLGFMSPWYLNIVENSITVQFIHRWLGILIAIIAICFWTAAVFSAILPQRVLEISFLCIGIFFQIMLGIYTLIKQVPLVPASAHQVGALMVFAIALYVNHRLRYVTKPNMDV